MPRITQLGRVMVPVADQDAAIAFYTDKLGFSLAADVPLRGRGALGRGRAAARRRRARARAPARRLPARAHDGHRARVGRPPRRPRRARGEGRRRRRGADGRRRHRAAPLLLPRPRREPPHGRRSAVAAADATRWPDRRLRGALRRLRSASSRRAGIGSMRPARARATTCTSDEAGTRAARGDRSARSPRASGRAGSSRRRSVPNSLPGYEPIPCHPPLRHTDCLSERSRRNECHQG